MRAGVLRDVRFWLLAAALVAVAVALAMPRVALRRDVYDVLAVVDITSSMNTRDVVLDGKPESRLEAAKAALRATLAGMPCQSRFGLGIFTERQTFLLFEPAEVCDNFAAIDGAITELTWRMGWEGGSYVAKGLYSGIEFAKSLKSDLIFMTDGHEAPPLPYTGLPPFEGKRGEVGGLLVGVGGRNHTPLIKYDNEGREVGTYGQQDVPQENRSGPPPPDAEQRPGYHPKWAPFGNAVVNNDEHMAFVREPHLKELSALTGLAYVLLRPGEDLVPALAAAVKPRPVTVASDIRAYPAGLALALLAVLFGFLPLAEAIAARSARSSRLAFSQIK
jgi:mxaL protein